MANTKENSINSFYNDNRNTSIDNKIAFVDGVYVYNHPIRKKALTHIWGTYNMLPDILTNSLGRLYEMAKEEYLPPKNYKSLFDYTHDKTSVYSETIAEKNITVGGESGNTIAEINETFKEDWVAWRKRPYVGRNYYEYFKENSTNDNDTDNNATHVNGNASNFSFNILTGTRKEREQLTRELEALKNMTKPTKPEKKDSKDDAAYQLELNKYKEDLKAWRNRKSKSRDISNKLEDMPEGDIDILHKTQYLFTNNTEMWTILTNKENKNDNIRTHIDSAVDGNGRSKGRNLRDANNDLFRVWNIEEKYGAQKNTLIRGNNGFSYSDSRKKYNGGGEYEQYSVLKESIVRITPDDNNKNVKNCMFSIENLAWKDVIIENELSEEQRGPNNGRIMWFPPYNLKFQENVTVGWNPSQFIGRGEKIYTYYDTERRGNLSFTILIDYPSSIEEKKKTDGFKDIELLRYFAGKDFIIPPPPEDDSNNNGGGSSEETQATTSNGDKLRFIVYFPFNFSGNDIKEEWPRYLMMGKDGEYNNQNDFRGYEISKSGLNTEGSEVIKNKKCERYFYLVDSDCCSKQDNEDNYKDSKSLYLNIRPDRQSEEEGVLNISFAEFYTLYLAETKEEKDWAIDLGILKSYNGSTKEFTKEKLNKLTDITIFNNATVTIKPFTSNQNRGVTDKLAKRRGESVQNFIKKCLQNATDVTYNISKSSEYDVKPFNSEAFSELSKRSRGVLVEISYNGPQIVNEDGSNGEQKDSTSIDERRKPKKKPRVLYNEADYFKDLSEKNNFLLETIIDKVKFFEPAYHSITPEGFNARLNFLHQCTRQGHTIERKTGDKANATSTAWNMAFGRPPVCVLRIGDFWNTKMLIESMSITYENGNGVQWDLNPEGIGVQPMFANVNLGIILIGGQSLDAPISRLNNAVSFNYYANSKMYDSRADFARYTNTGVTHDEFYIPDVVVPPAPNPAPKTEAKTEAKPEPKKPLDVVIDVLRPGAQAFTDFFEDILDINQ